MVKKASIIAVIVAILFSAVVVAGPAQVVLQDLAESEKEARLLLGYGFIGLGVVGGLVTTVALADYGLGEYGLAVGGLLALPGFFFLAVPSQAEREFNRSGDSETRSALALQRLADQGYQSRLISGIGYAAVGVASLLYPYAYLTQYDYLYTSILNLGMAAYSFLVPSKEEKALERYFAMAQ